MSIVLGIVFGLFAIVNFFGGAFEARFGPLIVGVICSFISYGLLTGV